MEEQALLEKLQNLAVIPVIAIESLESALPLADALIEGGLPVAEITFRTPVAGEALALINQERPELILGAGTVLTMDQLERAKRSGARFGVSPGLNPEIVQAARAMDLPFIPGVVTPTEVERAITLGARTLKFFPAEASGGSAMIKALYAPYAHLGVRFMPTGGVTMKNLEAYLQNPAVMMVGGTWIAKKDAITAGQWDDIRDNCLRTVELVRGLRQTGKKATGE